MEFFVVCDTHLFDVQAVIFFIWHTDTHATQVTVIHTLVCEHQDIKVSA